MIAELFDPADVECLVRTAVELWEGADASDLSERQRAVLDRARHGVVEEIAGRPLSYPIVTSLVARPAAEPLGADGSVEPTDLITRGQAEAWAGRVLSDDEMEHLAEAIPSSSIPDAISTIVDWLSRE